MNSSPSETTFPLSAPRCIIAAMPTEPLDDRDRAILDFEHQWPKPSGAKEAAIRDLFDLTATRANGSAQVR